MGLSASLPLALSGKQHLYYLLPAAPWLALALAAALAPGLRAGWERLTQRRGTLLRGAALLLLAGVALFSCVQAGRPGRDAALLAIVHEVQAQVPPEESLWLTGALHEQFGLHTYLARYGHWPLLCSDIGSRPRYALAGAPGTEPGAGWRLIASAGAWQLWTAAP